MILLQVEDSLFLQNHEFLIVGNEGKRYYKKVQNIIRKPLTDYPHPLF